MRAKAIMVLGTSSGVGKSFITAGLCRLFSDWGYKTAPFKAQNMSNNSYVTEDGGEIGRAQAVQAECARVKPTVDMNPVLLKPSEDDCSQVMVHGKPIGQFKAREYFSRKESAAAAMRESYERLASQHEIIVIEGAGSPAEVNLKQNDLVNMHTAKMAGAKCLLVADIDRGGVFASLIGTLELLEPDERGRVAGLIVNKFRGNQSLFDDGIHFLEQKTGKKVWGILPYDRSIWLEEEDSINRDQSMNSCSDPIAVLDIAVILLPRMSNFTDFEVLKHEPGVSLRYVEKPSQIGRPDLLILPGTKATIADLLYIKEAGYPEAVRNYLEHGGHLLGVCGGYQMMGQWIIDEKGIESSQTRAAGLGLLNMTTQFQPEKILRRISETVSVPFFGTPVQGMAEAYEIHMGTTTHHQTYSAFGREGAVSGNIAGTYYHGLFDHASFRRAFLEALAKSSKKTLPAAGFFSVQEIKEMHYNKLRLMLEKNLNLELLRETLGVAPRNAAFSESKDL